MSKDINTLITKADFLMKTEDYLGALEKYKEAVLADPHNAEAQFKLGETHHQLGELPAALSAYLRVVDLEPDHQKAKVKIEMIRSIMNFFNKDMYNP